MCSHTRFIHQCEHGAGTAVKYCNLRKLEHNPDAYQCPNILMQPVKPAPGRCRACHRRFARDHTFWWHQAWRELALTEHDIPGAREYIQQEKTSAELELGAVARELREATYNVKDPRDYYRDLPVWLHSRVHAVRQGLEAASIMLSLSQSAGRP
jgi:predicted amidophosphoribosyltransferase